MNTLQMEKFVAEMKTAIKKTRDAEWTGEVVKVHEVSMNSFVQILQAVPLTDKPEPVTWNYTQGWVYSMSPADQELLIGKFLNEHLGLNRQGKIIGIFEKPNSVIY